MIIKGYIESTLIELEKLYNKHSSLKKDIYYSKLSVIELCGWIEESCDAIVKDAVNKKLQDNEFKDILKNVIKNNHGFRYDKNFRPMLITGLGLVTVEKMQINLEQQGKISQLKSILGNLTTVRNKNAHTFLKGTTATIQAPSVTLNNFRIIYNILKDIENELKTI